MLTEKRLEWRVLKDLILNEASLKQLLGRAPEKRRWKKIDRKSGLWVQFTRRLFLYLN